jgi:hypothetical protein
MSAVRGRQTTEQEPAQLQEVRVAVKGELQLLQPRIGVIPMLGLLYESLYWARQTAPGPTRNGQRWRKRDVAFDLLKASLRTSFCNFWCD